jgi:hypothetical protein
LVRVAHPPLSKFFEKENDKFGIKSMDQAILKILLIHQDQIENQTQM